MVSLNASSKKRRRTEKKNILKKKVSNMLYCFVSLPKALGISA